MIPTPRSPWHVYPTGPATPRLRCPTSWEPDTLSEGMSGKGLQGRGTEAYPKASLRHRLFPRDGACRLARRCFSPSKTRFLPPASLERGNPCAVRTIPVAPGDPPPCAFSPPTPCSP